MTTLRRAIALASLELGRLGCWGGSRQTKASIISLVAFNSPQPQTLIDNIDSNGSNDRLASANHRLEQNWFIHLFNTAIWFGFHRFGFYSINIFVAIHRSEASPQGRNSSFFNPSPLGRCKLEKTRCSQPVLGGKPLFCLVFPVFIRSNWQLCGGPCASSLIQETETLILASLADYTTPLIQEFFMAILRNGNGGSTARSGGLTSISQCLSRCPEGASGFRSGAGV